MILNRTERQKLGLKKWILNKCRGVCEYCTGFGKTRVALEAIKLILNKYPQYKVLVIVPTKTLKKQWISHLDSWGFSLNADVVVINTAAKKKYHCDLLIIDEIHKAGSDEFINVFNNVTYSLILGLTATLERLDERHLLLQKIAPVIDTITVEEALINGWTSTFVEYMVLIDVPDIAEYKHLHKQFISYFDFFNYDFNLAMSMIGKQGLINRINLRDSRCTPKTSEADKKKMLVDINIAAIGFMRVLQARKKFINNHYKKIEIAHKILKAREGQKIITFSNNKQMASIISDNVYTSDLSEKEGNELINKFHNNEITVLSSCDKLNEGFDSPNVSVGIILGLDSSKVKAVQRLGRIIRKEENKKSEMFNIVIKGTVETSWFENSHKKSNYVIIDEDGLNKVLKGEIPTPLPRDNKQTFRY